MHIIKEHLFFVRVAVGLQKDSPYNTRLVVHKQSFILFNGSLITAGPESLEDYFQKVHFWQKRVLPAFKEEKTF